MLLSSVGSSSSPQPSPLSRLLLADDAFSLESRPLDVFLQMWVLEVPGDDTNASPAVAVAGFWAYAQAFCPPSPLHLASKRVSVPRARVSPCQPRRGLRQTLRAGPGDWGGGGLLEQHEILLSELALSNPLEMPAVVENNADKLDESFYNCGPPLPVPPSPRNLRREGTPSPRCSRTRNAAENSVRISNPTRRVTPTPLCEPSCSPGASHHAGE